MLRQQTKDFISGLDDAALLEYVMTGWRMYEPEAVGFARAELERRGLKGDQEPLRQAIAEKLVEYDARNPPHLNPDSPSPGVCQRCGVAAPTLHAEYCQNIGAVFVRFSTAYRGHFCRSCSNRLFWKCTLISFFLGWWGIISFFVTVANLVNNLAVFARSRSLPLVRPVGFCRSCGYDLRGTPDRCPECGTPVATRP